MEITFLTGNADKINSAKAVFDQFPQIVLLNEKVDPGSTSAHLRYRPVEYRIHPVLPYVHCVDFY